MPFNLRTKRVIVAVAMKRATHTIDGDETNFLAWSFRFPSNRLLALSAIAVLRASLLPFLKLLAKLFDRNHMYLRI